MVHPVAMPAKAFLRDYQVDGTYADCYALELPRTVSQAEYVEAFYTTPLFKLERALLRWLVARPSTDADARELAAGRSQRFAAWSVERQDAEQLLLRDFRGRTRSWLMAAPAEAPGSTRLHFGSAVVPVRDAASGRLSLGAPFQALLGFHKLYSRLLLAAAARRLQR